MNKVIAIDVETATRYPNSLCQISLVLVSNPPLSLFTGLIKPPENEFDSHIIKIHGISPEMTLGSPTLKEAGHSYFNIFRMLNLLRIMPALIEMYQKIRYYNISLPDMLGLYISVTGLKLQICNRTKLNEIIIMIPLLTELPC